MESAVTFSQKSTEVEWKTAVVNGECMCCVCICLLLCSQSVDQMLCRKPLLLLAVISSIQYLFSQNISSISCLSACLSLFSDQPIWAESLPSLPTQLAMHQAHSAMMARYLYVTSMMSSLNRVNLHNRA